MHDGFDITFREVIPESGILELVLAQLAEVRHRDGLHCSVVLRHAGAQEYAFNAHVELRVRGLHARVCGDAEGHDPYDALRRAFAQLDCVLTLH